MPRHKERKLITLSSFISQVNKNNSIDKNILLIDEFKKKHLIIQNVRYSYSGLVELLQQQKNNANFVNSLFSISQQKGLENCAKQYNTMYGNLILLFSIYQLPVDKLKQNNLLKSSKQKQKLSLKQINELKQDLSSHHYQYFTEPAKKFNITVGALKRYIKNYSLSFNIQSANQKAQGELPDKLHYQQWLMLIKNKNLEIIIKKMLLNNIDYDQIYQWVIAADAYLMIDGRPYCPLSYYIATELSDVETLPGEVWKPYPDDLDPILSKYLMISSWGRVYKKGLNTSHDQLLHNTWNGHGYLRTRISINGHFYNLATHKIIAETFIPNPQNKPFIDHINTLKYDNRVVNLRWATSEENNNNPLTRQHLSEAIIKMLTNNHTKMDFLKEVNSIKCYAENKQGDRIYAKSLTDLQNKFHTKAHASYYVNKGFVKNPKSVFCGWQIVKLEKK